MSFWYPDNANRRDRATQLSNDITVLQQAVVEHEADMIKADARMLVIINGILVNQGLHSFENLKGKLMAAMTPEERRAYEELIERSKQVSIGVDNALTGTSLILFFSGVTAKAIDIGVFLASGHVAATFTSYAKAFITLVTKGFEAGKAAFQAAAKSASLAVDFLQESSKLANYAARASRVLKIVAIVGVIADAFILAFSLYMEAQQRTALQGAINDLFVRRIITKFYEKMCGAVKTQSGTMTSYFVMISDDGEIHPEDQRAADKLAKRFAEVVIEDWLEITTDACYTLLSNLDATRTSWRNEDPDRASAIRQADEDIGIDNSVVKMFDGENAVKVVRKIFIETHDTPGNHHGEKARGHASSQSNTDKFVEYMQEVAVTGTVDKQKLLRLL